MILSGDTGDGRRYDRDYLLSAEKRNQLLELWEIEKFGRDSFSDPNAVSLYGLTPAEGRRRGVRILARTAVEAARDPLAQKIGESVAKATANRPPGLPLVIVDPFAGSCNALFWILRHLRNAQGIGFELDATIFDLTSANIALIGAPIRLEHGDYRSQLDRQRLSGRRIVAPLSPPWGDALDANSGLDVSRTKPPIADIVDDFERAYADNPILYVVEIHERLAHEPLARLRDKFDWTELQLFDLGGPTGRHGVLLGARRWS
jgi:hypothetical protein